MSRHDPRPTSVWPLHGRLDLSSFGAVEKAYEAFCDAADALQRANRNGGHDPETRWTADEAAKAYYEALADTLKAFNAPSNWRRDDTAKVPLPRLVAFVVGQIIENLVAGRVEAATGDFKHLFGGGRKGKRPGLLAVQRRAIEAAVRYVAAARAGLISENKPVKQVASEFGVRESTVYDWLKETAVDPREIPLTLTTARRREYGAALERHMTENAARYRSMRRNASTRDIEQ